jgi:hypothetical protein
MALIVTKTTNLETGRIKFTVEASAGEILEAIKSVVGYRPKWQENVYDPVPDSVLLEFITLFVQKKIKRNAKFSSASA